MPVSLVSMADRLAAIKPFDQITSAARDAIGADVQALHVEAQTTLFAPGDRLPGLYLIETGAVDLFSTANTLVSHRIPGDSVGDRSLLRGSDAELIARTTEESELLLIPAGAFKAALSQHKPLSRWFDPTIEKRALAKAQSDTTGLMSLSVSDLMTAHLTTCASEANCHDAAWIMRDQKINSLLVMEDRQLQGIVTVHDLVNKILAEGKSGVISVGEVMTANPVTISPQASGLDALMTMAERSIHHLPVLDSTGAIVGILGHSDLFRQQAATASCMASEIVTARNSAEMAEVMRRLPDMLSHLVSSGIRPDAICRRVTDLTDAVTRRLLALAEAKLGPPPVRYAWAACGSQGRREQTGVSDQDNCLILGNDFLPSQDSYFGELARFVCDGLNDVGFVYCPGDMMATNPKWRQPLNVWQGYFQTWIAEPDDMAQMLASVMFDLRLIGGDQNLFDDLQSNTLDRAQRNSIFIRQMIANSLKHMPPLGFFRSLSVIRTGAHKNRLDMKHAGIVPIVDLGRVYALKTGTTCANTRHRLKAAEDGGVISPAGARDLLDAYDMIAETRLRHQAHQIKAGQTPDNYLDPLELSELERTHLRDAFLVVKTMQSALANLP